MDRLIIEIERCDAMTHPNKVWQKPKTELSILFQSTGFVRNINAGPENLQIPEKISINDLTPSELKAFVEKVKSASCELLDEEGIDYREHFALKEELSRTDVSEDGALKHARQQVGKLQISPLRN